MRNNQPRTLIARGRNDPFFAIAGTETCPRDLPNAELQVLDASHFALEGNAAAIAGHIRRFLSGRTR